MLTEVATRGRRRGCVRLLFSNSFKVLQKVSKRDPEKYQNSTRSNKSTFKTLFQILLHVIGKETYCLATCIRLASNVKLLSRDQFYFRQNGKVSLVHARKGI